MLSAHHLITSVHSWWADAFPAPAPTIYPGTRLDTSRLPTWCELWVDAWSDPPRRAVSPAELTVSILVHCFARHPAHKTVVQQLAAAARETLAGRLIPIRDLSASPPVTLGTLRVREHSAQDLSRNHAALGQEQLQHLVLVFQASAQELST